MKDKDTYHIIFLQFVFIAFGVQILVKEQYGWSLACLVLVLVTFRIDTLKSLIFSPKEGIKAEFVSKIIENIIENNEKVNETTFPSLKEKYESIEDKVIKSISQKYNSSSKVHRHFRLSGNNIADIYIENPTGLDELYEIKYVKSVGSSSTIVKNGERQLLKYASLIPKKVKLTLILASEKLIETKNGKLPTDISVEYFKL